MLKEKFQFSILTPDQITESKEIEPDPDGKFHLSTDFDTVMKNIREDSLNKRAIHD